MNAWNVEAILNSFVECAAIARRIKENPHTLMKDDRTPVTDADKTIEAFLTEQFGRENVLGEETFQEVSREVLLDSLLHGKIWIIDPIDGTANFINRRSLWGISIAYAENGVIREGGVFTPEIGELMFSGNGKTFFASTEKYPSLETLKNAIRPMEHPRRKFDGSSCVNLSQLMTRRGIFSGTHPVISIGSCVCSGIDLALGRDAVYMTSAKLWDLAGILPCLRNLSFVSVNRSGADLLSCKISPEIYSLDPDSPKPFALREPNWIGSSLEAVNTIMPLCSL